jgi:hypothetical protein
MTVTLNLSPETERRLREKAAQTGQTLEGYLEQLLVRDAEAANGTTAPPSTEEWIAAWRSWASSHQTLPHVADDSRESIYAGRGE